MYVATPEEMRNIEEEAIRTLGIRLEELMERAGVAVAKEAELWLTGQSKSSTPNIVIISGKGNNGGDGFVAAVHLRKQGFSVEVLTTVAPEEQSAEARAAGERLAPGPLLIGELPSAELESKIQAADLLIDALFGFGFKGEMSGTVAEVARIMNASGVPILAVDIPSGVEAATGLAARDAIRASQTVSFTCLKLGQVIHPGAALAGLITVADIGIPETLVGQGVSTIWVDSEQIKTMFPERKIESHKKSCGRVLVVAGSTGLTGAAAMASDSALRIGAGLVTLAVPESLNTILEMKLTEVMTLPLAEGSPGALGLKSWESIVEVSSDFDILVVGPGLGLDNDTVSLVRRIVSEVPLPLVLDADGLNALVGVADEVLSGRPWPTVLTPHPGELGRLLGKSGQEIQAGRVGAVRAAAARWGSVVVLKGARSLIAAPPKWAHGHVDMAVNSTGNPGLASAGTGDILTGFIAGLWGQGLEPFDAALAGTFLHGMAGDVAAEELTPYCLIATDLLKYLPQAIRETREE